MEIKDAEFIYEKHLKASRDSIGVPETQNPSGEMRAKAPSLSSTAIPKDSSLSADLSLTNGVELIKQERQRQIEVEGWTTDHDSAHDRGELSIAAACYAVEDTDASVSYPDDDPEGSGWPWGDEWWKPKDRIRNLVRAGALIAAEIDREIDVTQSFSITQAGVSPEADNPTTVPDHSPASSPESSDTRADSPTTAALREALEEMLTPPLVLEGDNCIDVASWFVGKARTALAKHEEGNNEEQDQG